MDTGIWILYIAGFLALLVIAILAANIKNILGIRIRRPDIQIKDCMEFPEHLRKLFAPADRILRETGFVPGFCLLTHEMIAHERSRRWVMVYVNRQENTYAEIFFTTHQDEMPGYEVSFSTIYTDGTLLLTVNCRAHSILMDIPDTILLDAYTDNLADQYKTHRERALQLTSGKKPVALSRSVYISRQKLALNRYIDGMVQNHWIKPRENNLYTFKVRGALRLTRKMIPGENRRLRIQHAKEAHDKSAGIERPIPPECEILAFEQIESVTKRHNIGWLLKTAVFLLSVSLFSLAFGIVFDIEFVLILLGVLFLHELGHLLGMVLFRYKDLQILFIPLFGAAAIGNEERAPVYQRVIVALMGPLPGILIGYLLFYLNLQHGNPLLFEISIVMLLLNYLNLLPIMPLDGGQILKLILLERFPRGQAAFTALSAALLVLAATMLKEPIFWILAFVMLMAFPAQWRQGNQLRKMQQALESLPEPENETARLTQLLQILRDNSYNKLRFPGKVQLIQKFRNQLFQVHATWKLILGTMLLYIPVMILPLLVIFGPMLFTGQGIQWYSKFLTSVSSTAMKEPDWKEKLATASNPNERWSVYKDAGEWNANMGRIDQARGYFLQAVQEARSFTGKDLRLAQTLEAFSQNVTDTQEAITMLKEARDIRERQQGPYHPEVARNLEIQAWLYEPKGIQSSQGIQLLERVVAIRRQSTPKDTPALITSLQGLASYENYGGRSESAEKHLLESLRLARQENTEGQDYSINNTLDLLSSFYLEKNKLPEAERYLLEKLQHISDSNQQFAEMQIAHTRNQLGWVLYYQGHRAEALVQMELALKINNAVQEKLGVYMGENISNVPYLLDLSFLHREQNDSAKARKLYLEAVKTLENAGISMPVFAYQLDTNATTNSAGMGSSWRNRRWQTELSIINEYASVPGNKE